MVLSLLTLMALGTTDFARVFYAGITVRSAARAAVAYGSQSAASATDYTGMRNAATADAADVTGVSASATNFCQCSDGTTVNCTTGLCSGAAPPMYVSTTVTKTFTTIINYPQIPHTVAMSHVATMRVQ
jgi:Flp pilus assembly protein TadG